VTSVVVNDKRAGVDIFYFKGKIHPLSKIKQKPTMANDPSRKRPHEEINSSNDKASASEREYILNADGTVLHDHKGVSFCGACHVLKFCVPFQFCRRPFVAYSTMMPLESFLYRSSKRILPNMNAGTGYRRQIPRHPAAARRHLPTSRAWGKEVRLHGWRGSYTDFE
jgi:hypothetical protein